MTDLTRLKVSLTKHNAHKVAQLLKNFDADLVLSNLDEIKADLAQTRKNLSVTSDGSLPEVWRKVQRLGPQAIDGLMLLAIIFSHNTLIDAVISAQSRNGLSGTILRGFELEGKEYTNFARVLDQLGVVTSQAYEGTTFDFTPLFQSPGLGPVFADLLALKLKAAKWRGGTGVAVEANRLKLNRVLGVTKDEFAAWLEVGAKPGIAETGLSAKDQQFFQQQSEGPPSGPFAFRAGHNPRDIGPQTRIGSPRSTATRLHNEIQNRLYLWLKRKYGVENVATELNTGSGTSIDVAVRNGGSMIFYEIKTASSVRSNIRQALPQLLEYAHWIDDTRADELIIVSHLPATAEATRYVAYLRSKYSIPIQYRQFDISMDRLI